MPVVGIPVKLLTERLRGDLDHDVLIEHLYHLGCDVEGYATLLRFKCERCGNILEITDTQDPPVRCSRCGVEFAEAPEARQDLGTSEVIRMELLAVRPDMFDPGGLARTLRGYLGQQLGSPEYPLSPPKTRVEVDPVLATDACPRPAIACAVVRGIRLDDDVIKVLMNLQENLHWALGRDRKHASIGVYDLDTIALPDLRYEAAEPNGVSFVPLGSDPEAPDARITPALILERHPKGVEFSRLLKGFERYPLLSDAEGGVLSMPPIINSEHTRVTERTENLFIDVTGTNRRLVGRTLNVLVTSLRELVPDIRIEQVTIAYPDGELITPDFAPQPMDLGVAETARLLGIELDPPRLMELLRRMGHEVERGDGDLLHVRVPAYRNDILHRRDLMEDAAIAFGYHNITPVLVPTMTVGGERPEERTLRIARQALCGLGFLEVMTLQLSSEERAFDAMRRPRTEDHVRVAHPISSEQTLLRTTLAPGLLDTLAVNAHREYPQRIFEGGEVTVLVDSETGAQERHHLAVALIGPKMSVTEARAVAEAVLREFCLGIRTENADLATYLPGRGATVTALWEGGQEVVGEIGELHPEVLETFRLRYPAAIFELDLTTLAAIPVPARLTL